ncbi:hypothetical protein HMPREF1544_06008 [Mucor circinelloides 1006PhL]|uniref:Uncharacterized protein n=1 Tax=Mucor circinelloides f. circinelloides (strain 1006PhL) TaxID=1220926 RepID=S2JWK5_MUCC1|nr:hypothetical protein HMPREF1544_06008 [Mucor circinelloides 1006PhL]
MQQPTLHAQKCVEKKSDALECRTTSAFDEVPSVEDLMDLLVKSDGQCALSGATGAWCPKPGDPSSVLALNHIKLAQFGSKFDIANLQMTLKCFRDMKAAYTFEEFATWLNTFKIYHSTD